MKKYILPYAVAGLTLMGSLTSCSENYLNTASESDVTSSAVFADTEMLAGAVNGLNALMCTTYSSSGFSIQGFNGEQTMMLWYNDYTGMDLQWSNKTSSTNLVNLQFAVNYSYYYTHYPWYYYYMLIGNANEIIANADNAKGTQAKRDFLKAQTYTIRAYSYAQLLQFYSYRWVDSKGGTTRGVPLRLETNKDNKGDLACASVNEVYAQIYKDLDEALRLYKESGMSRGDALWSPDASVAHGVYARAALAKNDWATAATHAAEARKGYKLMTAADYGAGFNTANSEWMWEAYTDEVENLGVYGFFAFIGSNTPSSKGYSNIAAISKDLIDQIPAEDARRWIYMVPQAGESGWNDVGQATKGNFYTRVKKEYADYIDTKYTKIFAYMSVKFRRIADRAIGCLPYMRAAEMIYAEAEARAMMGGQEAQVQALLNEAVAPYNAGYKCTKTGAALLDEVKLYRRFDLWGEGHNWTDCKRWNIPMVRRTYKEGGSWAAAFCGTGALGGCYGVDEKNRWTLAIPRDEINYNKAISSPMEPENWKPGM